MSQPSSTFWGASYRLAKVSPRFTQPEKRIIPIAAYGLTPRRPWRHGSRIDIGGEVDIGSAASTSWHQGSSDPRIPPPYGAGTPSVRRLGADRRLTPGTPLPSINEWPAFTGGPLVVSQRPQHVGDEVLGLLDAGGVADEAGWDVVRA